MKSYYIYDFKALWDNFLLMKSKFAKIKSKDRIMKIPQIEEKIGTCISQPVILSLRSRKFDKWPKLYLRKKIAKKKPKS